MKRVFVVSEYVHEAQNSTGHVWEKVIDRLSLSEQVGVIAPRVAPSIELSAKKAMDLRFAHRAFNKNGLLQRLFGQFRLTFAFAWKILTSVRRDDLLLSGTNPTVLLTILPVLRRLLGFKWIVLVHDVFPENLIPAGILQKKQLSYKVLSLLFSKVYSSADKLLVIGRDMKELMATKIRDPKKIAFVPNWASDKDVKPVPRGEFFFSEKNAWTGRVVFQFFGNIGRLQGIENLLQAINLVKNPKAIFLFIGEGALARKVADFSREFPDKNVIYHKGIPLKDKNIGLAACDVALISLEKGMFGLGVPSKTYYSMAADKPLIAIMDKGSEISRLIDEHGIGWHCRADDPQALAALIDRVADENLLLKRGRSRQVLQENFTEDKVLDLFLRQVQDVLH